MINRQTGTIRDVNLWESHNSIPILGGRISFRNQFSIQNQFLIQNVIDFWLNKKGGTIFIFLFQYTVCQTIHLSTEVVVESN